MILTDIISDIAEVFRTVLVPIAGVLGRWGYTFIRDFKASQQDNLKFQGEMIEYFDITNTRLDAIQAAMESFARENQSTVLNMSTLSGHMVDTKNVADSIKSDTGSLITIAMMPKGNG